MGWIRMEEKNDEYECIKADLDYLTNKICTSMAIPASYLLSGRSEPVRKSLICEDY
jgi:hypothetical protein